MSQDNVHRSTGGNSLPEDPAVEFVERTSLEDPQGSQAYESDGQRPFLSVVIPAYNEERSVRSTVRTVVGAVDDVCDSYEIIVVDDGSDDATPEELRDIAGEIPSVRFMQLSENRGKGHAIRDGCQAAAGENVLFMDADGDITAERIASFMERVREEDADVVIGSKRHPDSEVSYPLERRILSWCYSALIRLLFGLRVKDTQVGMKLLRGEAVEDVMPLLLVERYAFDVELLALARQHGYEIAEAPVSIDFDGDSNVDWLEICRIAWDTVSVFCRLKLLGSYEKLDRAATYAREYGPGAEVDVNE